MTKLFPLLLLLIFISCNSSSKSQTTNTLITKTANGATKNIAKQPIDTSDSGDDTPTQNEERERLSKTYGDVKIIDSTFINDNDTLHFHLKYYCLKNSSLVIPKRYDLDGKKEFVTHPFVSDVILTHDRDTVLKKQFNSTDFNPFFTDNFGGNLKKYGSMDMPDILAKNKDKSLIIVHCPIGIPSTDIGIGLFLIISKSGDYKIVDHY